MLTIATATAAQAQSPVADRTENYAELGSLPDWSGIWLPHVGDQNRQASENLTPWQPQVAETIATMWEANQAGRPAGIFNDCLPEGMPTWMMISHNALEFLFTPGRVTMLGESDGNRLRRIYTDGRTHPEDPDLTFHGDSVGRWEDDVLIVDTIGVLPTTYIAINEAVGVHNGGDMHIRERIYLEDVDTMHVDMEIDAPRVLLETWETRRIYIRGGGGPDFDIIEGVCLQGSFVDQVDEDGNAVFVPLTLEEQMKQRQL